MITTKIGRILSGVCLGPMLIAIGATFGMAADMPASDEASVALANQLVEKVGVAGGIVCLPRCRDAGLAVALAKGGRMVVQAMSGDAATVAALAKLADSDPTLRQSLYTDEDSPTAIPFADDYVNLLLVTDATDENLAALSAADMVRVLAPVRGVALVGSAKGSPGVLTKDKLADLFKGFPEVRGQVVEDQSGLWIVARKPAKPGAVPWTHRYFDPSNNTVSSDTACAWPLMTQWLARPYIANVPFTLAANGRLAAARSLPYNIGTVLEMRDLHNGVLLWQRELPAGNLAPWCTSGMALGGDNLYLLDGSEVLGLNAESGKEAGRVTCAELGAQVKWLAVQDGVLYVMAGEKKGHAGTGLGAYDLATGKWLWKEKAGGNSFHDQLVGLYGGRLYHYGPDQTLYCRQAKTGAVIWKNAAPPLKKMNLEQVATFFPTLQAFICAEKTIAIRGKGPATLILSADDGTPLWSLKRTETIAFYKNLLLSKRLWALLRVYDALTGEESVAMSQVHPGSNCGMFSLTPNLWLGQSGPTHDFKTNQPLEYALNDTFILDGMGALAHKTPCGTGWTVAEGVAIGNTQICVCDYVTRGLVTLGPAPAASQSGSDQASQWRRTTVDEKVEPLTTEPADWPTFRANPERGNASRAVVPAQIGLKWTWRPATAGTPPEALAYPTDLSLPDRQPVQATTADGLVFAGGGDRTVTALDLKSGAVRWRFFTGGRLFAPPTIADGRCFIGAGDGVIYCLEAANGRELWRYRVPPRDRRIMVYGDLLSTWPITGGVLVQGGTAYAIAGLSDLDGTYVVALEAPSGKVKWRNDDSGHMLDTYRRFGVAGAGYPALANGRLWIHNASYDLATGQCQPYVNMRNPLPGLPNGLLRRYTGIFAGNFLVTGGQRFFNDQYALTNRGDRMRGSVSFQGGDTVEFLELKEDTDDKWPAIIPWDYCRVMPSWDDRQLIAMPVGLYKDRTREEDLVCWDAKRTAAALHEVALPFNNKREIMHERYRPQVRLNKAADSTRDPKLLWPPSGNELYPDKTKGEQFEAAPQLWRTHRERFLAAVLAANAAVAVSGSPVVPYSKTPQSQPAANKAPEYFVTAFNRANGQVLWEIKLPDSQEPLMDGLSIARNGTLLVRLLDGGLVALGPE